jgi:hypothetical protein
MIEPVWPHLKRITIKKGAPKNRAEAERAWRDAWAELEQWRIQAWIERIPRHIKEIIKLYGGNEYREGKLDKQRKFQSIQEEWEDIIQMMIELPDWDIPHAKNATCTVHQKTFERGLRTI